MSHARKRHETLHVRLVVFDKESSVLTRCIALSAAEAFCESMTWGSDVELEAMEIEQTYLPVSLKCSDEPSASASLGRS